VEEGFVEGVEVGCGGVVVCCGGGGGASSRIVWLGLLLVRDGYLTNNGVVGVCVVASSGCSTAVSILGRCASLLR